MIKLQRVTEPSAEPITYEEADLYLRAEGQDQTLIEMLIGSARDYCETYCNRAWARSTWYAILDHFPSAQYPFCLRDPSIVSVDAISYLDAEDANQTSSAWDYDVERQLVIPSTEWPTETSQVVIEYTAGLDFATSPPASLPKSVKAAMLLVLTDLYENRSAQEVGATISQNPAVGRLLDPYRVGWGI